MPIRSSLASLVAATAVGATVFFAATAIAAATGEAVSSAPAQGEFPVDWYFTKKNEDGSLARRGPVHLEGKPAPKLSVKDWIGEQQDLSKLAAEDRIVVVDFWATWCRPCVAAIPKNVEMATKFKDDVVIIGVHDANSGADKMPAMAKDKAINYPLCVDLGDSAKDWGVSFWPTYLVIDHEGVVRAAGLKPDAVSKVVEKLLDEKKKATAAG